MLKNVKFEKREVNVEEIWNKNGIWKSKSEKWTCESGGHGDGKNMRESMLKVKNKGRYGV